MSAEVVLTTALFACFLVPVTIQGLSVNYSFLLLPVLWALHAGALRRPPLLIAVLMALYTLIFAVAFVYQYEHIDYSLRRLISFVLFMSMFAYAFIRIDAELIRAFKAAIVLMSATLSAVSLCLFFALGGSDIGYGAWNVVGDTRVGFLYVIAIWIVFLHRPTYRIHMITKYLLLWILLSGLLLTFSRASIVALVASFAVFLAARGCHWLWRPNARGVYTLVGLSLALIAVIWLIKATVPLTFAFYEWRLVSYLMDADAVSQDLGDASSSGGARIFLLMEIIKFVLQHPLTGSGYLGVWILPHVAGFSLGSAHNQYTDVLFRTGVVGFVAYMGLLGLILRHLYRHERSLFWGFIGVLIYGMFHETFKEAHGGFLLAFLLGMLSSRLRIAVPDSGPAESRNASAHRGLEALPRS